MRGQNEVQTEGVEVREEQAGREPKRFGGRKNRLLWLVQRAEQLDEVGHAGVRWPS